MCVAYAVQIHQPENNSFLEGFINLDHNPVTQAIFPVHEGVHEVQALL